jgi:hypothetical protein
MRTPRHERRRPAPAHHRETTLAPPAGHGTTLTDLLESAKQQNLSALEVASRLADEEKGEPPQERRRPAACEMRRFPEINTIDGFDFDFAPCGRSSNPATSVCST